MSLHEGGGGRVRTAIEEAEKVVPEAPRPLMRELPPADPFPVESLGDVLAPATFAIHDRIQAPLAICGQSVLASTNLTVQAHADVELPTHQLRPLTNYYVSVAATGERKTSVDAEALWPVRKREAALRDCFEAEQRDHQNAKIAWEKARDAVTKSAKGDRALIKVALDALGPAPVSPLVPLLTCPEPTYEGIIKLFAVGWPSLGIFAAEGGQFIGGHGMTDEAKLRTAAGLSAAWDGEPFKRVRSGEGVSILPGRRLWGSPPHLDPHLMAVGPEVARYRVIFSCIPRFDARFAEFSSSRMASRAWPGAAPQVSTRRPPPSVRAHQSRGRSLSPPRPQACAPSPRRASARCLSTP